MADSQSPASEAAVVADVRSRLDAASISQRLTPQQAEAIYSVAYRFLEQGQFDRAREFFWGLATLRASEPKYWCGLAMALRRLERHDEAAAILGFVERLEPQHAGHGLDKAECLLMAGLLEEGREALEHVMREAGADPAGEQARQRAQALLALVRSKETVRDGVTS